MKKLQTNNKNNDTQVIKPAWRSNRIINKTKENDILADDLTNHDNDTISINTTSTKSKNKRKKVLELNTNSQNNQNNQNNQNEIQLNNDNF